MKEGKNDNNSKVFKAVKNLQAEIREFKEQGKELGKIFNLIGNDCYIFRALEEVGLQRFESDEELNRIMNTIREALAKEIVRKDSTKPIQCDSPEFE